MINIYMSILFVLKFSQISKGLNCDGLVKSRHSGLPVPGRQVKTGVQRYDKFLKYWIPAGVYPDENRGRNDGERGFRTFYEFINCYN